MTLKAQLDIQRMYAQKIQSGKNDIQKRDDVIDDLKRKLTNISKKDIIIKSKAEK